MSIFSGRVHGLRNAKKRRTSHVPVVSTNSSSSPTRKSEMSENATSMLIGTTELPFGVMNATDKRKNTRLEAKLNSQEGGSGLFLIINAMKRVS